MSSSAAAVARPRHRVQVSILFGVAVLVGFLACFAVWVNRQALNTDNWTKTSGNLIANQQIDDALGSYLVDALFSSVNVGESIKSALPKELQPLSGPAAAGLRLLANRAAPRLLESGSVQAAWRRANRTAHRQLLQILNGGGTLVSTKRGQVTLDLHQVVVQLAGQLGVESQVATVQSKLQGAAGTQARATVQQKLGVALPPTSGRLVILRSTQLRTAQDIATAIRGLALVLPLLALALFALAVWLAEGWRRIALRTTGWCLFAIGLLILFVRRLAGDAVVNNLVSDPANKPAAHAAWSIGTSLLYDLALAVLVYGLLLVCAAWLAGSTRAAVSVRRTLAPWLRDHPVGAYASAGGILLVVVLWGPTPATRQPLPVLGIAALIALGIRLLRRQCSREFPDILPSEVIRALRQRIADAKARFRGRRAPPGSTHQSRLEVLEGLAALHQRGALTDAEFAAEKSSVIGQGPGADGEQGPPVGTETAETRRTETAGDSAGTERRATRRERRRRATRRAARRRASKLDGDHEQGRQAEQDAGSRQCQDERRGELAKPAAPERLGRPLLPHRARHEHADGEHSVADAQQPELPARAARQIG